MAHAASSAVRADRANLTATAVTSSVSGGEPTTGAIGSEGEPD
jgi:hypothetical protein